MLKLLRFLWTGTWHDHTWEIIRQTNVRCSDVIIGTHYECRCKECGHMKSYTLEA